MVEEIKNEVRRSNSMFNEICIYEAKLSKLEEIEELMKDVAEFYMQQEGVVEVHYIKRTDRKSVV